MNYSHSQTPVDTCRHNPGGDKDKKRGGVSVEGEEEGDAVQLVVREEKLTELFTQPKTKGTRGTEREGAS